MKGFTDRFFQTIPSIRTKWFDKQKGHLHGRPSAFIQNTQLQVVGKAEDLHPKTI